MGLKQDKGDYVYITPFMQHFDHSVRRLVYIERPEWLNDLGSWIT